jgi:hypothetical protein
VTRPNDARWVRTGEPTDWAFPMEAVKAHKARPGADQTLCGIRVGGDVEEDPTHRCGDCILTDLVQRGEVRLVQKTARTGI